MEPIDEKDRKISELEVVKRELERERRKFSNAQRIVDEYVERVIAEAKEDDS